jgi:two-component system chemotaxis sensor kinase CheA
MNPEMARYVELFLAESREHLTAAHALQDPSLPAKPHDRSRWREFMRHVHSIKGMAAAMHFPPIVTLTHAAEELAERLAAGSDPDLSRHLALVEECLACLGGMLDAIERGQDPATPLADALAGALRAGSRPLRHEPGPDLPAEAAAAPVSAALPVRHWQVELRWGAGGPAVQQTVALITELGRLARIVRASPPTLDPGRPGGRLSLVVASADPPAALQARLATLPGSDAVSIEPAPGPVMPALSSTATGGWLRVPAARFDALLECALDLKREQGRAAARLPAGADPARQHLGRAETRLRELCGALLELRLVPFESVAARLRQAVHALARELGKHVRFELSGGQVGMDRGVLEELIDPLLQALRNAVDHGVEPPEERRAAGKPPRGTLRVALAREGERLHLSVTDDGRGMCPAILRRAAVDLGVFAAEDAAQLTDEEALLLATLPRLTTRPSADHISGRGVGLDVVRTRVEALGGFVELRSRRGLGCELHLHVPVRRALIPALIVRAGPRLVAIPVEAVDHCLDTDGIECSAAGGSATVVRLSERLGLDAAHTPGPGARRLVLRGDPRSPCLLVDEVLGRREVMAQPLGAPLAALRVYTGAALLEDGSIALLLDPVACVGRG